MKSRKTLSNWLTNRYLLIIRNEENFAEKTTFSFNYARFITIALAVFIVLMVLSLYLSTTILSQWFDPRHSQLETKKQLVLLTLELDSLERKVQQQHQFIDNFQSLVRGEVDTVLAASLESNLDDSKIELESELNLAAVDSQFRKEFEEEGITFASSSDAEELQELFFFSPLSGIVSSKFNLKEEHYGIDVVAKANEPVRCVADGMVIFSDWTSEGGNVIAVQHRGNLISVYKHNSGLLKKVGNFVNAGDIVAIIGNTGELTDGPHLHFEMWFNGNPVNPEEFVSF